MFQLDSVSCETDLGHGIIAFKTEGFEAQLPAKEDILELTLDLLESGRALEADNLLTSALLENPQDGNLWLAAGFCRLRRGAVRSAAAAFQMGAWLTDDEMIREILSLLEEISL